jgi:mannose-6-phosphate isomerase-like protein (cupin superfamily)
VLPVGSRYLSERGTSIEIVGRSDDRLTLERRFAPNTGKADPHLHQDFTQIWEAVEGRGMIEVDGADRELRAGDRVELAPSTPHRDPYNEGDGGLRVRGTVTPRIDFVEAYAESWAHHLREGTTTDQDEPPLLQIFLILKESGARSYRSGVPVALQKATLPLAAGLARLRGYRARYD